MRTTKKLYQWDTDQKLINCVGKYVDYPIDGGVYRIDVIDKECIIPDELLQVSGTVKVYECMEYGTVKAFEEKCDRMPYAISIDIAPLSMMVFKYDYVDKKQAVADAPATAAIEKKPEPKKVATAKKSTAKKSTEVKASAGKKPVEKKKTK